MLPGATITHHIVCDGCGKGEVFSDEPRGACADCRASRAGAGLTPEVRPEWKRPAAANASEWHDHRRQRMSPLVLDRRPRAYFAAR